MAKATESELEILQVLWEKGASTVRFVNEQLNAQKESKVGYTTTLKMMQIMTEKQLLRRDTSQRTHIFQANVSQEDFQKTMVDKMLNTVFGGSAMKLVQQALGNKKTSKEEIEQIKTMIEQMENEKGGKK